jgi:O-antigen/teichoic acid export membrane protein
VKKQILGLGKDAMIYGIGSVVRQSFGLITLPLFTAYLSPEEYGVLAMLGLLSMVAQPVLSLGMSAAMGPCYFEGDDPDKKSTAVWTTCVINALSGSALIVFAWHFSLPLTQLILLPSDYAPLVSLSLTGCALTIMVTPLVQRVQFERHACLYVTITFGATLGGILISVVTVVFIGMGVKGMVVGQLAGNTAIFVAFLLDGLKNTKVAVSVPMMKELLRQGLPLVPSFGFLFILMHANKYLLQWCVGLDAVGIYSIGYNLGMTISMVTSGIATAWYPFFMTYMERQADARHIFGRILTYYVFSVGTLCDLYFVVAKPVVLLLTTGSFHRADVVVGFVALAYFSQTLFNFFLPGLYFNHEVKYVSVVQAVAAVFSLPFNYFLISRFAYLGAAIGLAVGSILMASLMFAWNSLNRSRYPLIDYDWTRISRFIIMSASCVIFYVYLPETNLAGEIIKSLSLSAALWAGVLLLLSPQERSILFSRFIELERP